jgi:hypothetical protein
MVSKPHLGNFSAHFFQFRLRQAGFAKTNFLNCSTTGAAAFSGQTKAISEIAADKP